MTLPQALPTYDEAERYLAAFTNYERVTDYKAGPATLGTERMEALLDRLGRPAKDVPALHVAGSKGKGSTAAFAAALLHEQGLRVGLFVSPHVTHLRERIQIDGVPVGEERFCQSFARVHPAVEAMRDHPSLKPPTYFEILTALAYVTFQEEQADVAVVEVGMGGRLDATNVSDLDVVASAITPVSLDHTRQLGDTLRGIAAEKAGIVRAETPLVLAPQEAGVETFLRERAETMQCPLHMVGEDLRVRLAEAPARGVPEAPMRVDFQTWRADHEAVALPFLGEHQLVNAAVALGLAESFLEDREAPPLATATLDAAWSRLVLPGRVELVARAPYVILDGAHNPASAWMLGETLATRFETENLVFVFGCARDKDARTMLRVLAPLGRSIFLTSSENARSAAPEDLRVLVPEGTDGVRCEPDPRKALHAAREAAGEDGVVCVTGSLYLVSCLRADFREGL